MQQHHMEWPLMTRKTVAKLTILITLFAASTPATGQCIDHPLTASPGKIDIRAVNVLEALTELGQTNSVCFGIEVADDRLVTTGVDWRRAAPLGNLLQSALSNIDGYRVGVRAHVVSISPARSGAPTWLDAKIPDFSTSRRADVGA
jgi:hypothetical protein